MWCIELNDGYGVEQLRRVERPVPVPGPHELLLRMRAASLNYRDLVVVRGEYGTFDLPLVPLSDGVGEVIATGDRVSRFRAGDRVCPAYVPDWIDGPPDEALVRRRLGGPLDGVFAELLVVPETAAVAVPPHLSDVQAATLPIAGVTAWRVLHGGTPLVPGSTVVVQGTGGVALYCLQLARLSGARVIVVSGTPSKAARLQTLGAEHVIDRHAPGGWDHEVLRATGGRGAELVVDLGGGDGIERSIACTRVGGTVALVGFLSGFQARFDLALAMRRQVRLQAVSVGSRADFESLARAIHGAGLTPVVDRVFPLAEYAGAFAHLAAGAHMGKIAISFPE